MAGRAADLPEVGATLRLAQAGSSVVVGRRIGEGGQGVVHEATVAGRPFALKWLRPSPHNRALRQSIGELAGHRPHPAFIWPIDLVTSPDVGGFGYVMPLVPRRFVPFSKMLNGDPPPVRVLVRMALEVVDAFSALHAAGLCYRDVSFQNVLVDPVRAEVAILDIDNVGTDGGAAYVRGTHQFMAPEVVRGEALPSTATDLYSLAVFLFYLFVHGHPLEGQRAVSSYSWAPAEHMSDTELVLRNFGTDPLFVFDPSDDRNRPVSGSPMWAWWDVYPRAFQRLFVTSFTTGLTDASLIGRVIERTWRRALRRLADTVAECSCGAAVVFDPDEPGRACWHCRMPPPPPPVLSLPGHLVVLSEGAVVTSRHFRRDERHEDPVAVVERAPARSAHRLVLRNVSREPWTVTLREGERTVEPQRLLGVRAMAIEFGTVRAQILGPEGEASPMSTAPPAPGGHADGPAERKEERDVVGQ